jgi:hypothetical protein
MKRRIKRQFVCALLMFAYLLGIGPLLQFCVGEAEKPEVNCPAGDPNVRIRAEIRNVELIRREEDAIQYRIHAHISITNVSTDPVFVLGGSKYPYPNSGGVLMARTETQASSCRYVYSSGGRFSLDNSPYWQDLRNALDHETPPEDAIRRIEPRRSWEFDSDIDFGITKYHFLSQDKNSLDEIRSNPHVWLQVKILMWPNPIEQYGPSFPGGLSLQKRWRPGHLIIEDQKTEPVELILPLIDGAGQK